MSRDTPVQDLGRRRLLLVDDNLDIRRLYARLLEKEGFVVEGAEDGAEALRLFEARPPDLLIVDLYLGHGAGSDLVRRLRRRDFSGGVVVWSASSLLDDRQCALDAGANAFVVKPVDMASLCAALDEVGF